MDCLADLVKVAQASAEVNHVQLVGNENGDVIVPTYDWADHFDAPFRQTAPKGIKSFHHFSFNASQPGEVAVQTVCDGPRKQLKLLSDPAWRPQRTDLPPIITFWWVKDALSADTVEGLQAVPDFGDCYLTAQIPPEESVCETAASQS